LPIFRGCHHRNINHTLNGLSNIIDKIIFNLG
jgi:hypothetical protein